MKYFLYIWGCIFPALNREERKKVYKRMLEEIKEYPNGFCWVMFGIGVYPIMWKWPELYRHRLRAKPNTFGYWWPTDEEGIEKRKKILEEVSR